MRISYIISAYKQLEQVVRLVRRLHNPDTSILIHVDKRSGPIGPLLAATAHLPRVHFLDRHPSPWGSFGHVAATLKGIDALVSHKYICDYTILLTGQDYPIKDHQRIRDDLHAAAGRSFMHYFALPIREWARGGLDRIEQWHLRVMNRHLVFPPPWVTFPRRRFPAGLQPFGGSSYWCLAWDCVHYVHQFVTTNPRFTRFFRYVDVPDELFFQTILLNSPLRDQIVNDDLRYIDWRDPTSDSPAILTTADFAAIQASPKLFARKFDTSVDERILDLIDSELLASRK
jgi:hypothetical protein